MVVMRTMRRLGVVAAVIAAAILASDARGAADSARLRYARDVRPILADHCFSCHGPDAAARKAGLRLDVEPSAAAPPDSGRVAIASGQPDASELIARIDAFDADVVMPPPAANRPLTVEQKALLRRWIAEGASYEQHWAYEAPTRPPLPPVTKGAWGENVVDRFVLATLEREGFSPSPEADRSTLIRRVTLDLTGSPPSRAEAETFLADSAPDAYEKLVDRLLASSSFGERMAVDWLDAARYADSNGYQVDRDRELYAFRDWVIEAFSVNMPYDQFTVEQLAGDLLPSPTRAQRIATGFHRSHMVNEEGGAIPEEFLAEYTADRVETTATVWMGQTFNCARCHDHKFDPFTQRDFYGLKAFFHNVSEQGIASYDKNIRINNPPFLRLSTPDQEERLAELQRGLASAEARAKGVENLDSGGGASGTARSQAEPGKEVESLKGELAAFEVSIPTTPVMAELPTPRPTYVLQRGAYNKPGEEVQAATPAVLPSMPDGSPRNRLGLAHWLMAPENPLTARVAVNRFWQALFGTGLVATSNDFGSQGAQPSHAELLDWLAVEFRESGWDVKRLLKLIVSSATYRQSSRLRPELLARDAENRWLARGPRFRLQAEFVRDQALAASGLLVPKVGGPSVKPYHPPGLYEQVVAVVWVDKAYVEGKGDDLHRRSMYTYWKRSVPHPSMLAFDAPFREGCSVRRIRTNTPMQALALMNDPTYVEAARFLAGRMLREGGSDDAQRIAHGFWLVLSRPPRDAERTLMLDALRKFRDEYAATPADADALARVGVPLPNLAAGSPIAAGDQAAFALVASLLLCRDEALVKN